MRYAAVFVAAAGRAAAAAWLASVFGDDAARADANLGVALVDAEGGAWHGGCAAVDDATAAALSAGGGATVAVSGALDENDPGAPARWWLAQAGAAGLTRAAPTGWD